jgi:hypothetical protein
LRRSGRKYHQWTRQKINPRIRDQTIKAIKKVRKLPLPPWYLPKGTINATEGDLENGSSSCERWGICCGALVVVAVIAELVIAWIEPPYTTFLTDSAIEVLFGMWDGRIQTELRRRSDDRVAEAKMAAAQAHERAAVLEKEAADARERTAAIEKLTSWRKILPEQHSIISQQSATERLRLTCWLNTSAGTRKRLCMPNKSLGYSNSQA